MKTHAYLYNQADNEDQEEPQLSIIMALLLLAIVTVAVTFSAEYLVGSIEGLVSTYGISETFVGLILLPIVGNAAEVIIILICWKFFLLKWLIYLYYSVEKRILKWVFFIVF